MIKMEAILCIIQINQPGTLMSNHKGIYVMGEYSHIWIFKGFIL